MNALPLSFRPEFIGKLLAMRDWQAQPLHLRHLFLVRGEQHQ
jgi:hypothetical protein